MFKLVPGPTIRMRSAMSMVLGKSSLGTWRLGNTDDARIVDQIVQIARTKDVLCFSLRHKDRGFVDDVQFDESCSWRTIGHAARRIQ